MDIDTLVNKTEGFVGADIESFVREAAMIALRKDIKATSVTMNDFNEALLKVRPSVSDSTAKNYRKIDEYYLKQVKAGGSGRKKADLLCFCVQVSESHRFFHAFDKKYVFWFFL